MLYQRSAARVPGLSTPESSNTPAADAPGVRLLDAALRSGGPVPEDRARARRWLETRLARGPAWVEAWARFFIGISLLEEEGVGRRQQGLVSLAHVPARFGDTHPTLSASALDRMIEGLDRLGDRRGADALRNERTRRYGTGGSPVRPAKPPEDVS